MEEIIELIFGIFGFLLFCVGLWLKVKNAPAYFNELQGSFELLHCCLSVFPIVSINSLTIAILLQYYKALYMDSFHSLQMVKNIFFMFMNDV